MDYGLGSSQSGQAVLKVFLSEHALLLNPLLNKGMAFSAKERELFNLWGLLPPGEVDLEVQRYRSYKAFQSKPSDIEKYIYLRDLQDSNETLFYSLLCEHIEELMPIVYTPVVGQGCERYSHIYRRPRGLFIAWPYQKHIEHILSNKKFDNTKIIVVSDGERILGLGDQGAGGMGIPIGKLSLYTACAGIYPGDTLPILLDTGTDNRALQHDPLYIGWPHPRIRGQAYADFIESFVSAVEKRFPHVLLHWEDFARENAGPLLDRYKDRLCTFNDDIQGTAAVALGALLAACRATKRKISDQNIVILGAGSAGCGIARFIRQAIEDEGLSRGEALQRLFLVDREGLLLKNQALLPFQREFARDDVQPMSLLETVRFAKASVLIGVSGQRNAFTEEVVRSMLAGSSQPIIFPLSNPVSHCEAHPADLLKWTDGLAMISTGSPFDPISFQGRIRSIDQTNNCYIFPGVGLALTALQAKRVPDTVLMTAARALADCSPARENAAAALLPSLREIRHVSFQVALSVAKDILAKGLTDLSPPSNIEQYLIRKMWQPTYLPYEKG